MAEVEEIKDEVIATVESELDAWESFYRKFKKDYAKISEYEKRIRELEEELEKRDSLVKKKLEKERGSLLVLTGGFIAASLLFIQLISASLNVWLYLLAGMLIGLGGSALLYLWTR